MYKEIDAGIFFEEEINKLKEMEIHRTTLLSKEERLWRLKSREIWITKGDNITQVFHIYTSHRKSVNTIT